MARRILLHLGAQKTGSSALQDALFAARDDLEANQGISYLGGAGAYPLLVDAFRTAPHLLTKNRAAGLPEAEALARAKAARDRLNTDLQSARGDVLILSNEGLGVLTSDELMALKAALTAKAPVTAVYFYRRPFAWLSSKSQLGARTGALAPYGVKEAQAMIYDRPRRIQEVFGAQNTELMAYDDLPGGSIVSALFSILGRPVPTPLASLERRVRISLSQHGTEARFLLNALGRGRGDSFPKRWTTVANNLPGPKYQHPGLTKGDQEALAQTLEDAKSIGVTAGPPEDIPLPPRGGVGPISQEALTAFLLALEADRQKPGLAHGLFQRLRGRS